jgi:hypothetical protein
MMVGSIFTISPHAGNGLLIQFMIFEGLICRLDETFCDAVLSNNNTGLEMMGQTS